MLLTQNSVERASVMQSWRLAFDGADLIEPAGSQKRSRQFAAGHA
ncbi:hypothetical protein K788_0001645 (plasmid) [Paraburkholderia caribensis MBA4]|uniref:Uncharacterized protein n=1 Tax=Paraburkholderia caribensis MBA4 TaxID=1323664 RepID=A0A0N7JVS1_9BURK|nr:hypothetical protein K788_0001645 [Paraburkholderia caribensis MBA4]